MAKKYNYVSRDEAMKLLEKQKKQNKLRQKKWRQKQKDKKNVRKQ